MRETHSENSGDVDVAGGATARRALRLLEALVSSGRPRPLDELAAVTGLTKSTAYRLMRVLQDESYVERGESGYRLGSRMVALAAAAIPEIDLYAAVRPVLARLARSSGETTTLHRRNGDLTIVVLAIENEQATLRRAASIGEVSRLTRGCAGLTALAIMGAVDRRAAVARAATGADREALTARVDAVRRRGYALSTGENHPGVSAVATGVAASADTGHELAVAVSGPAERWSQPRREAFSNELREAAAEISTLLALASASS